MRCAHNYIFFSLTFQRGGTVTNAAKKPFLQLSRFEKLLPLCWFSLTDEFLSLSAAASKHINCRVKLALDKILCYCGHCGFTYWYTRYPPSCIHHCQEHGNGDPYIKEKTFTTPSTPILTTLKGKGSVIQSVRIERSLQQLHHQVPGQGLHCPRRDG